MRSTRGLMVGVVQNDDAGLEGSSEVRCTGFA